jgi:PhnB protein
MIMAVTTEAQVKKDLANRKITITRQFDAAPQEVWDAWTQSDILDRWWAPKPWRAVTKEFDFKVGGKWIYSMVGPNNERHWARVDYTKIDTPRSFDGTDSFADENGVKSKDMPETNWHVELKKAGSGTELVVDLTATKPGALEKLLEMGFEEGFKMGLDNLEEYLEKRNQ